MIKPRKIASETQAVQHLKYYFKRLDMFKYHESLINEEANINQNVYTWDSGNECFEYRFPNLSYYNSNNNKEFWIPIPDYYQDFLLLFDSLNILDF